MRVSHFALNRTCHRVCATEHAPGNTFSVLERRHGLAEIVERGAGVLVLSKPCKAGALLVNSLF